MKLLKYRLPLENLVKGQVRRNIGDISIENIVKVYAAESYDEWDNKDDDKWGAQAWGKDIDGVDIELTEVPG